MALEINKITRKVSHVHELWDFTTATETYRNLGLTLIETPASVYLHA